MQLASATAAVVLATTPVASLGANVPAAMSTSSARYEMWTNTTGWMPLTAAPMESPPHAWQRDVPDVWAYGAQAGVIALVERAGDAGMRVSEYGTADPVPLVAWVAHDG